MATLISLLLVCVFAVMWCDARPKVLNVSMPFYPFKGSRGYYTEHGNLAPVERYVIKNVEKTVGGIVGTYGWDTKPFFSKIIQMFKNQVKLIFPGTRWCGDGDIAKSENDLGMFREADKCCRDHDKCPEIIEKGEVKHNLKNGGLFTRVHCVCDKKFYHCLKASNDIFGAIGWMLGTTYFTILGPQCFQKEYPIVKCIKRKGWTKRCVQYQFDTSAEKIYQWFDNPEY